MAAVAECGWAGGPGSVSCSHAETQTDLPACCGSFVISLMEKLALAHGKLPSDDGPRPAVTAALPSTAPAADPAVAEQTGTGAAGRTELADDNILVQGPDVEPQAPDQPVTDSLQRSAGEASQEAQTAPRTGSTVAAPQAVVTPGGVELLYDEDIDIKIEEFEFPEADASQQGAAPEPDGQTTPEAGRSGADPSPAALGPFRLVRTLRKRSRSPPPPPESVRRRRRTNRKQKAAAASEQSAGSSSSAPADGPAARPQPQPPRTARRRPASAGSSADIGAVGAQPHAGSRTHCCPQCGKAFATLRDLQRHELTHTGERPYSCKECGKKFSEQGKLIIHRRTHTGERPYSCEECGKKFSEQGKLIRHRRTHTGERPYSCEECGKKFSEQCNLITHHRIHTGERPYSCEECGQKFGQQSNLIAHRRIHTGERPYSCEECGRKFSQQSNLNKHRRTHTAKQRFVCCSCGGEFHPETAPSKSSTAPTGERQLQCAGCKGSAALKEQDPQAPPQPPPPAAPQPVPVKQQQKEPLQSADPLATTDLTAAAGPSTAASKLAGWADLQTASGSYGTPVGISADSVPACNRPGPYQTAQDLPSSSLRSYPGNRGHFPAPVVKATETEDLDVANDPDSELKGDGNCEPERDQSYRGKVSSQQNKSASEKTTPRGRRISDSSDGDESPIERRVTPARSAKQQNSVQTTNLESRGSGEGSDTDADQFDFSGSESSWQDGSAESSEDGI